MRWPRSAGRRVDPESVRAPGRPRRQGAAAQGLAASGDATRRWSSRASRSTSIITPPTSASAPPAIRRLEQALDALAARGVKLAICTNKPERLTHLLLDALGWTGRFAAIVGGDTLPVRKPDPAPLHEAIARAGGGRAAFVGDSITDADTAKAARPAFVAVSFGFSDRPVAELGADAVIDHYAELIPALRSRLASGVAFDPQMPRQHQRRHAQPVRADVEGEAEQPCASPGPSRCGRGAGASNRRSASAKRPASARSTGVP